MKNSIPTVLVIFGATGDLIAKKIIPALFHLYQKGKLPKLIRIIGVARRDLSDAAFRTMVIKMLEKHHELSETQKEIDAFISHCFYHAGTFQAKKTYTSLAETLGGVDGEWRTCANKLFYLAVPPSHYKTIFTHLADSGLTVPCGPEGGWTRVLVEKPFGNDEKTAEELDLMLGKLFQEEQIYRIDHYLAKEMLQNILTFRFSNNMLESSWNNKYIESIEIKQYEDFGVEGRGAFYDGVGALRDVGQNHLLQMLALITMDKPADMTAPRVRPLRTALLRKLRILNKDEIRSGSYRAQYAGYQQIIGVDPKSQTETYFKVKAALDTPRWQGVPITLEHGKVIKDQIKEIAVTFKHTVPCLCPADKGHYQNKIIFSLEPHEEIKIFFLAKALGLETKIEERTLDFTLRTRSRKNQYVEEYEKLLLDCIEGNQLLFVSTDEVKAMWRYVDPIISAWADNVVPLHTYTPHTTDILKLTQIKTQSEKFPVGVIGLGKMGANIARNMHEKGWTVYGYNRSPEKIKQLVSEGLRGAYSFKEMVNSLPAPRVLWLMAPAGEAVDEIIFGKDGLAQFCEKGDIIVDAGNSFYKDAIRREKKLQKLGITFIDIGVSGGPGGARSGACLMIGGKKKIYEYLLPLLVDISVPQGVQHFEGIGAGHFVKMIHNGIEYGMMQAIAEGYTLLKDSSYSLDLKKVTEIYNHGSVIESRLIGWLASGFQAYGENLEKISGSVGQLGEGAWTVKTAKEMNVKIKIIEESLKFRFNSEKNPSYTGKILSTLRNQFGGHSTK